jgi:alkanesulfonate monooxygenase SsuD/methylene tetrahydromethanopterin reductase-like flavin-dependent oxidoreductase (luciferase family)
VHDIVGLESLGVPSVFAASTEFVDAVAAQSRSLGADPAAVYVPHPIQDRTDDEVRALADAAVDALLSALQDVST